MRICDLKEKEVINVCDGRRLGYVEDVEFDLCTGKITHIIIPGACRFFGIFGREEEFVIEVSHICKVGCDLILVEVNLERVRVSL
jgi:YlmC/YmxH family sporulation protein